MSYYDLVQFIFTPKTTGLDTGKVVILRGVSGSGKSDIARRLCEDWEQYGNGSSLISSADHAFEREDGSYRFDAAQLGHAHNSCLSEFVAFVRTGGIRLLIVDNTNTRLTEVAPYAALGEAFDRDVVVVTVACPVDIAAARNRHGVPREVIEAQAKRLEAEPTPAFWRSITIDGTAPRFDKAFRDGAAALDADDVNYCIGCAKQVRGEAVCDSCRNRIEGR